MRVASFAVVVGLSSLGIRYAAESNFVIISPSRLPRLRSGSAHG
jgi:hypothetical protein